MPVPTQERPASFQEILGMDCQVLGSIAREGLTLCGVLFPEYHAALAVACKVAGVGRPPLCWGAPRGPRCHAGIQDIHRIPTV